MTKGKGAADEEKVRRMRFAAVYPSYVAKAERKGRKKAEVDAIIAWLTGYDAEGLGRQIESQCDLEAFFAQSPRYNPNAERITGSICGYRVEEIEDGTVRKVRQLDKLIDELAKGWAMERILRS